MLLRSVSDIFRGLGNFLSTAVDKLDMYDTRSTGRLSLSLISSNAGTFQGTHQLMYWKGPCDADALAGCSSSADGSFFDLDEVSFHSFQTFTGYQNRLLLFYKPSVVDPYFVANNNSTTTWLSDEASTIEPVVGRVNCLQTPSLCTDVDISNGPRVQILYPQDLDVSKLSEKPRLHNTARRLQERLEEYGTGVSQCLWRRFGAEALTSSCHRSLTHSYNVFTSDELQRPIQGGSSINSCIQEGRRIAFVWNALVILACLVLLAALGLAGWKQLKKCLVRCCCCFGIARSSASMSKEERKAQLQQQIYCFYFAAVTLGFTNLFLPAVSLWIGGPVAVATLVWLWYVEFKCATPCMGQSKRSGAPSTDEKQVALLSDAA